MLPSDAGDRKRIPMVRGLLDYFPDALAEVAKVSQLGNDQHNPGEEIHWARGKSMDHADCLVRHLMERGILDDDGVSHTAKMAWRALALLQEELEQTRGLPLPRGARYTDESPTSEPPSAVPPPAASVEPSSEGADPGASAHPEVKWSDLKGYRPSSYEALDWGAPPRDYQAIKDMIQGPQEEPKRRPKRPRPKYGKVLEADDE